MNRKEFLKSMAGVAVAAAAPSGSVAALAAPRRPNAPAGRKITRGVSFYSYQEEIFTRAMTLEDCVAEVASMGAEGIQLISEAVIPNYPNPPESWVREWHALMARYGTRPTALDTYWDFNMGEHRTLSFAEAADVVAGQLRLCHRLGFPILRPTEGKPTNFTVEQLIEKVLPLAEKLDIRIAPELHAPYGLKGGRLDGYLDLIQRTGTKHFGITLDTSVFQKRYPRIIRDRQIRDGVLGQKVATYITDAQARGEPKAAALAAITAMGASAAELRFLDTVYNPALMQDPQDLIPLIPYIFNVHAKILDMTEDLTEYSIPFDEVIPVLVKHGYQGSIDTEYEGQRHTQDAFDTDSCEQVRRNQVQLRRLLGEI